MRDFPNFLPGRFTYDCPWLGRQGGGVRYEELLLILPVVVVVLVLVEFPDIIR